MSDIVIRGSSAGIFRNGEFQSDTDTGCPRRTWLRHKDIQQSPNEFTKQIFNLGFQFEDYYAKQIPHAKFEVEVKDGNFTGHADAVDDEFVYETKSCSSKSTYLQVFKKGVVKSNHLIQLLHYMISLERQKGKLVYGSYVTKSIDYSKLKAMPPSMIPALMENAIPEIREFIVEISEDGFVIVDGEPYENLHVTELLDFRTELTAIIEADELPPIVQSIKQSVWNDVCKFCPFNIVCESNPASLEDFTEMALEVIDGENLD